MVYRLYICLLVLALALVARAGDVPVPPMQGTPWTEGKSTTLAALRPAVEASFAAGLADPRGCEWREVTVRYYDPVGPRTVDTTGWVLPAGDDPDAPRYAITWDGIVHPVVTLGPPGPRLDPADLKGADTVSVAYYCCLHADLLPGVLAFRDSGEGMKPVNDSSFVGANDIDPRWEVLALLWRAGEVEMAEAYANAAGFDDAADAGRDSRWTMNLLAQGVGAFNMQDDVEARRHFGRLQPIVRAAGDTWESPVPRAPVTADLISAALEAIEARTDDKLTDEMRWLREQFAAPEWLTYAMVAEHIPDADARLTLYLSYLPMVSAADTDNLATLLAAEGHPAVPQLMEILRHDTRLCGELDVYWQPTFGPGASGIAESALQEIYMTTPEPEETATEVQEVNDVQPPTRAAIADAWAAFLAVHGDQTPQERWRAILRDDDAGVDGWLSVPVDVWQMREKHPEPRLPTVNWTLKDDPELQELYISRIARTAAVGDLRLLKSLYPWRMFDEAVRRVTAMPEVPGATRQAVLLVAARRRGVPHYDALAAVLREQNETDPTAYEVFAKYPDDPAAVAAITWLLETQWPDRSRLQAAVKSHPFLHDFPIIRVRLIDHGLDPDPPPPKKQDTGGWGF